MINTTMKYLNIIFITMLICLSTQIGQAQTLRSLYSSNQEMEVLFIEKNTNMEQALEVVEERFNILFIYRSKIIKDTRVENEIMFTNGIENTLDKLFEGTDLEYANLKHKTYGIYTRKEDNPESLTLPIFQETITGTVRDASNGEPLPGVNISILGTTTGTSTNIDGQFELTVPSLDATLVFSYIGYQEMEIPIDGLTEMNVEMQQVAIEGEEMVVTAFGIQREAKSLTYSTQGVSTSEISEVRETNVINSLTGKVAGLAINQDGGGVGNSSRVVIRGNRSISGSSEPLYVVDGVSTRGDISNLNPDNIESITVLKGPNAAALYGSAAQNGAIVVTTKRAAEGEVSVSLSNNFMISDPNILTNFQNEYGQGSDGVYNRSATNSWGPRMDGQMVQHWSNDPELVSTQIPFSPQPNNIRDQFQRGYNNSSNLTASIGGENTQTLFSYTFTNAEGMVPNNTLQRHNVNLRVNSKLTNKLSLDSKLSFLQQKIDHHLGGQIQSMFSTPRNINIEDMSNYEYTDQDGNVRQNTWTPNFDGSYNGYWIINNWRSTRPSERIMALASLTYEFTENLSLMARTSYDGSYSSNEQEIHNDTGTSRSNGVYSISQSRASEWNGDFLLSYKKDLTDEWYIEGNFGGNAKQHRNNSQSSSTGSALTVPNFFTISNAQNPTTSYNPGSPVDVYSLYSFAQIAWRNSVFLDVTARRDRSSTLPAENRNYVYPSIGLSAIISDLTPTDLPDFFTYAKVRASWAKVGNSAPAFMTQRFAEFIPGGYNGFLALSNTLPSENLLPEETESYELGLDLIFFEGRIGLDITGYKTNTRNQLFTVAVPPASGASSFFTNGGDVENSGIEVLMKTRPIQTQEFNWNMDFNFAKNRNMVKRLTDDLPELSLSNNYIRRFLVREGDPFGTMYSKGFERDDQGRVLIDNDGMPLTTPGQTVPVANFNPDWNLSLSSSFSYRNFDASFLVDHRQGGSMISITNALLDSYGMTERTLQGREGGLIFGDNLFSDETAVMDSDGSPNATEVDPETFWRGMGGRNAPTGEPFVVNATNTRLREMTLGYNFSESMLNNLPISSLRISLIARNLFFFHRDSKNIDPDIIAGTGTSSEGLDSWGPPVARTFGFNFKIEF